MLKIVYNYLIYIIAIFSRFLTNNFNQTSKVRYYIHILYIFKNKDA